MSDEDEAPEAVSMKASKAEALANISSQQRAIRHKKEVLKVQRQSRDSRLKEQRALKPLPETVIEEAFENKRAKKKKISTKTVFAKEEGVVPEEFHKLNIIMLEGMDKQQKATVKERYAQVEGIRQQRIENVMRIPGIVSFRRCLLKRKIK